MGLAFFLLFCFMGEYISYKYKTKLININKSID